MSVDPAAENERVRRHTPPQELEEIDERIERNIRFFGSQPQPLLTQRIQALEQEWSVERWLGDQCLRVSGGGRSHRFDLQKEVAAAQHRRFRVPVAARGFGLVSPGALPSPIGSEDAE